MSLLMISYLWVLLEPICSIHATGKDPTPLQTMALIYLPKHITDHFYMIPRVLYLQKTILQCSVLFLITAVV